MEVCREASVTQAEACEGYVQDTGLFPNPRLWGGVLAIISHGGDPERASECSVLCRAAGCGDEASGSGEGQGEGCNVLVR